MYINAYFACTEQSYDLQKIEKILDKYMIRYVKNDCIAGHRFITFNVPSTSDCFDELMTLSDLPKPVLSSVYSDKELRDARWLCVRARFATVECVEKKTSFESWQNSVKNDNEQGFVYRMDESPISVKRQIKWKPGHNFCGDAHGALYRLFCSDLAKATLLGSPIRGIGFSELILEKSGDVVSDTHLLSPHTVISHNDFSLCEEFSQDSCAPQSSSRYTLRNGVSQILAVRAEALPEDKDICITEKALLTHDGSYSVGMLLVSGRFYSVVTDILGERNLKFVPAKLV